MLTPVYNLTVGSVAGVRTLAFGNGSVVDGGNGLATYTAPSTSPGGSSGQLQYNSGGSFAGAAALTYATSGANLTVTASGAAVVPLMCKGTTNQTANLFECQDVNGSKMLELVGGTASLTLLRVGQNSGLSGVTYGADGADRWTMYTSGASGYAWQFGRYGANNCFAVDQSDRIQMATNGIMSSPPGQVTAGTLSTARTAFAVLGLASQSAALCQLWGVSSTSTNRAQGDIDTAWADSTDATRKARVVLRAWDTAARECVRLEASGTAAMVGLYGTAATAQYATTGTVTGYTGGGGTALTHSDTFTGNTGSTAYTIGDVVRALKLLGVMAA